jgi:hypothetical protein
MVKRSERTPQMPRKHKICRMPWSMKPERAAMQPQISRGGHAWVPLGTEKVEHVFKIRKK